RCFKSTERLQIATEMRTSPINGKMGPLGTTSTHRHFQIPCTTTLIVNKHTQSRPSLSVGLEEIDRFLCFRVTKLLTSVRRWWRRTPAGDSGRIEEDWMLALTG